MSRGNVRPWPMGLARAAALSSIPSRGTGDRGTRRAAHQSFPLIATAAAITGPPRGVEPTGQIGSGRRASSLASAPPRAARCR
jgi:hypothetical protein